MAKGNVEQQGTDPVRQSCAPPFSLLLLDAHYVAIDKPPGMLVHRSRLAAGDGAVLQGLRDQLGAWVYPVHRLDRPTSGVLLFGRSPEAAARLSELFRLRAVAKDYLAVVRGYTPTEAVIDYALEDLQGRKRDAVTRYRRLATVELPVAVSRYPTSRYTLVHAVPETGRRHQIRRHFHHIFHPLIGDTTYGEGRHNRLFSDRYGIAELLLMARRVTFEHPFSGACCEIVAPLRAGWRQLFEVLAWGEVRLPGVRHEG